MCAIEPSRYTSEAASHLDRRRYANKYAIEPSQYASERSIYAVVDMRASEPLSRHDMRASEALEPPSICEQVRGSRLVLGRRFGRRFVFGRFWPLLIVVWGAVLVVRVFGHFGRFWASYGASFCFDRFWSLLGVVWGVVLF